MRNHDQNELGSDSIEDDREFDDDDQDDIDLDDDLHRNNRNIINNNNTSDDMVDNLHDNDTPFDDDDEVESNLDDYEDEEDEDESDEDDPDANSIIDTEETNKRYSMPKISKKKIAKEAALWWDEDNALNELTSSTSFDFGSQYHLNNGNSGSSRQTNVNNDDQVDEELETLESILKTSQLFSNSGTLIKDNLITMSTIATSNNTKLDNQVKRLSLL